MRLINFYILFFCISLFVCISCKPLVSKVDKINKERSYKDKNDYVSYYSEKLEIDSNKVFFFKNERNLYSFFENLKENKLTYFYGVKRQNQLYRLNTKIETNSCLGLINSIVANDNNYKKNSINVEFDLDKELLANNLGDNPIFNEKLVIFILSDKLGDTNIKNIKSNIKEMNPDMDYLLISVDNYFYHNTLNK